MKRFVLAFLIVFSFGLFAPLFVHKTYAGILGGGWPCTFGPECKSNVCIKPLPFSPIGACLPASDPNDQIRSNLPAPLPGPCATGKLVNGSCTGVNTSLGVLDTNPSKFIGRAFLILLGGAGGVALILLMRAGYQIMTARGNPEGLQKGREQLIAAIVGLLFLIFSFLLLQVIGIDILQIPGFGATTQTSFTAPTTGNTGNCEKAGGVCVANGICGAESGRNIGRYDCGTTICCRLVDPPTATPTPTPVPGSGGTDYGQSSACSGLGGTCNSASNTGCSGGSYVSGKCPGPADWKCCVPRGSGGGSGSACQAAGGFCASNGTCGAEGGRNIGRYDCGSNICCKEPTPTPVPPCVAAGGFCAPRQSCIADGGRSIGRYDCGSNICCKD